MRFLLGRSASIKDVFEILLYGKYGPIESVVHRSPAMSKSSAVSHALAWPFLLPGNIACDALRLDPGNNLVRMLVNSLVWPVLGVIVVAIAV
jgi:hypothetical protein